MGEVGVKIRKQWPAVAAGADVTRITDLITPPVCPVKMETSLREGFTITYRWSLPGRGSSPGWKPTSFFTYEDTMLNTVSSCLIQMLTQTSRRFVSSSTAQAGLRSPQLSKWIYNWFFEMVCTRGVSVPLCQGALWFFQSLLPLSSRICI